MKHVVFLIAVLSLLFGCAHTEPAVKVITQEVKVPVREVCIQKDKIPNRDEYITVKVLAKDSNVQKAKKLVVHYKQSQMYIKNLEEIINGCSN